MITVNGCKKECVAGITLKELLLQEGYVFEKIAVEKNGTIIAKATYETEWVSDGDCYEVVNFVGGG